MSTNKASRLEPVRDYSDVARVQAEIGRLQAIPTSQMSDDDIDQLDACNDALRLYMSYCPAKSLKPAPAQMLAYLMGCVKINTTEQAAAEMGMATSDLEAMLNGQRLPTTAEAGVLSGYFQVV